MGSKLIMSTLKQTKAPPNIEASFNYLLKYTNKNLTVYINVSNAYFNYFCLYFLEFTVSNFFTQLGTHSAMQLHTIRFLISNNATLDSNRVFF